MGHVASWLDLKTESLKVKEIHHTPYNALVHLKKGKLQIEERTTKMATRVVNKFLNFL